MIHIILPQPDCVQSRAGNKASSRSNARVSASAVAAGSMASVQGDHTA
jgi:hypothetical protein